MDTAHFRIEKGNKIIYQSIETHLNGTADLAEGFTAKIKMPYAGKLLGLLHDSGKFGAGYQAYLQECIQYELGNRKTPPIKGSVDHGIFKAAYIMELTENEGDPFSQVMVEALAMIIAYHHGGLRDYLSLDTASRRRKKTRNTVELYMKKWKRRGNRRKSSGWIIGRAVAGLLLSLLLARCSRERMDIRREIDRIYKEAENVAEDRATAYISEKYGIEAAVEGYWVQAYNDFFAPYINSNVVVFMEYGERKYCVGIDVDNEAALGDNYQRMEIDAALQGYFMELYGLPKAYRAETVFRLEDAPNYHVATPSEWRVLYGIKDMTRDIDLGCISKMADKLEDKGYHVEILRDGSRRIVFSETIEIFENWIEDKVILFEGLPIVSVDGMIQMKEKLGREKDLEDILRINEFRNSIIKKGVSLGG